MDTDIETGTSGGAGAAREPDTDDLSRRDVVDRHYRELGPEYDRFLHYSDDFVRRLTSKMLEKLRLEPHDVLVDLGCGTGIYTLDLLEQVELENPVLGVDPFEEMLRSIPDSAAIEKICEGGLEFSERDGRYDKILIKETVHHIEDRPRLFANLRDRLRPGGVLLLVHVPPDVAYPLFDAALRRCLNWHADPDGLVTELSEAGFRVERDGLDHRHDMPKQHYFDMVRNRYMSVLHSFTDEELAAGLREMEAAHAAADRLSFVDHFDYITATRV